MACDEPSVFQLGFILKLLKVVFEALKKEMASENKIKELNDKQLYQEAYNRPSLSLPVVSKMHLKWCTSFSRKSLSWKILKTSSSKERFPLEKRRQVK